MFELSIALKYLIPRKKHLSVSLIAFLSVGVISLVVWLVIVFLSVTEGIEKNWLEKLTALNAPLRITPTEHYYSSYYYLSDTYSSASHFASKNIAQKASSSLSDPYVAEEDATLPARFPKPDRRAEGTLKDPVKEALRILEDLKRESPSLAYQDYEISGALMRLQLLRENKTAHGQEQRQSFLTQVSYLASIPDRSPHFARMLAPPKEGDLDHLYYLSSHSTEFSREDAPSLTQSASSQKIEKRLRELLSSAPIQAVRTSSSGWRIPFALLPENKPFAALADGWVDGFPRHFILSQDASQGREKVWRSQDSLYFQEGKGASVALSPSVPIYIQDTLHFDVEKVLLPAEIRQKRDIRFQVRALLQKIPLAGVIAWENLDIERAAFNQSWPAFSNEEKEIGVLLAKNYRDSGVLLGDRGYLSYNSATASSIQEQRMPIFVAGFYDPGILSVGNRCILVPPFVTQTINASSTAFNLDKTQSNGLLVWMKDVQDAPKMKQRIEARFAETGIAPYWKVTTYREYDFARDLLEQFQSDKYLFSLIAAIILLVACCNIISLLTLLVNDKKKEIGILQAMGASTRSIAIIFGTCGIVMGLLSCLIGTSAAVFTLKHIDSIVSLLSYLQGREAFHAAFFGDSLPNALSGTALRFIFLLTPLLALLAGLIPALKACRLRPSEILRSE
ncbi:MAG TPA: FtsX-like permease family protein [Rhabdochlamydiaceae bacterium]|jgi:lipoprotein-releasing system permease protein